jgi:hypothetical protein
MTLYNKTKQPISIGSGKYSINLPASVTAGVRGAAVNISDEPMKRLSLSQDYKRVLALQESGAIEIEE